MIFGTKALPWGLGAGAAIGAALGLSKMSEKGEDYKEQQVAKYEAALRRRQKTLALNRARQQQNANVRNMENEYHLSHAHLPRGRGGREAELS